MTLKIKPSSGSAVDATADELLQIKTDLALQNVSNTSDANKPVSTATQTALNDKADASTVTALTATVATKAPLASPAFTGTPTGITKSHVGLGNVDNTSDANKPVSTAQATAIAAKHPGIAFKDEGLALGNAGEVTEVDITGEATATRTANKVTVNVPSQVQDNLTASAVKAPSADAVNAALATKAESSALSAMADDLNTSFTSQIASKESVLTFTDLAERIGNTVSVKAPRVAGSLLDGKSAYFIVGSSGMSVSGPGISVQPIGTWSSLGPNNPTNSWNERGRGRYMGTAGAANWARLYTVTNLRGPLDSSTLYGGFKMVMTYAPADALTSAVAFVGVTQNSSMTSLGSVPSGWTGGRFGLVCDVGDTNWKLYNGSTLIQDLGSAFPCHGNETNPIQFEIEATPNPNFGTRWKVTHLLTGAVASGVYMGTAPGATWACIVMMTRDSAGATGAAGFSSTGYASGTFYQLVVGDSSGQSPAPVEITGNTTLTKLLHANRPLRVNSATNVVLTVDSTGFEPGDMLYGLVIASGAASFQGNGFTLVQHEDVPPNAEQKQAFSLECVANANWYRLA